MVFFSKWKNYDLFLEDGTRCDFIPQGQYSIFQTEDKKLIEKLEGLKIYGQDFSKDLKFKGEGANPVAEFIPEPKGK